MPKFKIVSSTSKNKVSIGDQFLIEDGKRTVVNFSKKYVHMDNGYAYPVKMFHRWFRMELEMNERAHHQKTDFAARLRQLEEEYPKKPAQSNCGQGFPCNALRYII